MACASGQGSKRGSENPRQAATEWDAGLGPVSRRARLRRRRRGGGARGPDPSLVLGALAIVGCTAAACGVALDRRMRRARSQALRDPLTELPEPRPARRPHRAGAQDLPAVRRALHAHLRRPRRLQGRERRPRARRRRRRPPLPRAALRGDRPGERHRRPRRRRRVRDPLARNRERRSGLGARRPAAARAPAAVPRRGRDGRDRRQHRLGRVPRPTAPPPSELLARADGQMYATKRDAPDDSLLLRRGVDAGVIRDVESALARDELVVLYQPIIDLADRRAALRRGARPPAPARPARSCRPPTSSRTSSGRRSSASSPSSSSPTRSARCRSGPTPEAISASR